jgi:hypothetical protein
VQRRWQGRESRVSTKADAEARVKQFLNKHGREGFFKLFLTNYLYELAMYYLHSEKNPAAQIREDTSYRFYVDGQERVYSPREVEKFKHDLLSECRKKAELIVENLKEMEVFEELDENIVEEPEVAELVQKAFESITQKT